MSVMTPGTITRVISTRRDAPLVRAKDAHYIDTTGIGAGPVVEQILAFMGRDRAAGR